MDIPIVIGDRVRGNTSGSAAIVVAVRDGQIKVKYDGSISETVHYMPTSSFVIIKSGPKFKIGDRVKYIGQHHPCLKRVPSENMLGTVKHIGENLHGDPGIWTYVRMDDCAGSGHWDYESCNGLNSEDLVLVRKPIPLPIPSEPKKLSRFAKIDFS